MVASIADRAEDLFVVDGYAMVLPASENDRESALLARVADLLSGGPAVDWTFISRYGNTVTELERIAAAHNADHIVIGRSRRRRFVRTPSVSTRVARRAGRPVIVIP